MPPRGIPEPPQELGRHRGLAYALFCPPDPRGGVVTVHGARSSKEAHYDFARAARAAGLAAVAFDQRGYGDSEGELGAGAIDDVLAMAEVLPGGPVALRGSSMGGLFALLAADRLPACAVVAIAPAPPELLLRGLRAGMFETPADQGTLDTLLESADLPGVVRSLRAPLLLLHAEGDEVVPPAHSAELHDLAGAEDKRLVVVPGGHHRSVQHDPELTAVSLRFLARACSSARAGSGAGQPHAASQPTSS